MGDTSSRLAMAARLGAFLAFALVLNMLLQSSAAAPAEEAAKALRVKRQDGGEILNGCDPNTAIGIPPLPPFPSNLRREGLRRCWSLWEVKSTHVDPPREVKCRFRKKNRQNHQL